MKLHLLEMLVVYGAAYIKHIITGSEIQHRSALRCRADRNPSSALADTLRSRACQDGRGLHLKSALGLRVHCEVRSVNSVIRRSAGGSVRQRPSTQTAGLHHAGISHTVRFVRDGY